MTRPILSSTARAELEAKGLSSSVIDNLPDTSIVHYNRIYSRGPTPAPATVTPTVRERTPFVGTGAAEAAFIASEFGISPERGARAGEAVEAYRGIQRTPGGTPAPILSRLQEPFTETQFAQEVTGTARGDIPAAGLTGLIGALAPQTLQTRAQLAESRRQQLNANRAALMQMRILYPDLTDEERAGSAAFTELSRQILTGERDPQSLEALELPRYAIGSGIRREATRLATELATPREAPTGGIIEPAPLYMGRLLSAPVSAAIGIGEAAVTDKPIGEAIPERIQAGESTTGAGRDIGIAAAEATGIEAFKPIGTAAGFAAEFITPLVPGAGLAAATARTGSKAARATVAGGARAGADVAATQVISRVSPSYALRRTEANPQLTAAIEQAGRMARAYRDVPRPDLTAELSRRLTAAGVDNADETATELVSQIRAAGTQPTAAQTQAITRQLAQRITRPGAETVRITPTTAAPEDIARAITQDYSATPAGRLSRTIRENPQEYVTAGRAGRPMINLEAAARDAGLTDAELIDYLQTSARRRYDLTEAELTPYQRQPARLATMFSGAGTVEAGLTPGVARSVDAVEYIPEIMEQFNRVHGTAYVPRSVIDLDVADVAAAQPEVFHASPVCKNFSKAKRGLDNADELDRLSAEKVAQVIREVRPPIVTVENVADYQQTALFKLITDQLTASGYRWSADVVDAAEYGGAQSRKRLILRAVRRDIGELPPAPEKTGGADWYPIIEDLIADAPDYKPGRSRTTTPAPPAAPPVPPILRNAPEWERRRLLAMSERGTIDLSKPILSMGGSTSRTNVAARNAGQPAPTLKSSPKEVPKIYLPDGTAKVLTPRMMARLSGLPDSVPVPQDRKFAKTVLGNGIEGNVTRRWFEPLYGVLDESKDTGRTARALVEASVQRDLRGMSLPRYNAAAVSALEDYALRNGAEDLTTIQAADAATGRRLRRTLTPRELRPGAIRTLIDRAGPTEAEAMTPGLEKLIDDTGRELGTMGADLLRATRARERASGLSRPEAFMEEVVSGGYGGDTRRATREAMYGLYGAFDSIGQALYSSRASRYLQAVPADIRAQMARIMTALTDYTGDNAKLTELRDTLASMQTSPEAYGLGALRLPRLLEGTSAADLATGLNLSGSYSSAPPMFAPATGLDLIGLTYSQAKTGRILTEALTPQRLSAAGISYDPNAPAILLSDTAAAMEGTTADAATIYNAVLAEMAGNTAVRLNLLNTDSSTRVYQQLASTPRGREILQRYDEAELSELLISAAHRLSGFKTASRPRFEELKGFITATLTDRIQPIAQLEAAGVTDATRRLTQVLNLEGVEEMLKRVSRPEDQRLLKIIGELIDVYDIARTGDLAGLRGKAETANAREIIKAATLAPLYGAASLLDSSSAVSRWVKGGLLAGRFLPNLVYMGMNLLTAPAIVFSTIGTTGALSATARMPLGAVTSAIAATAGMEAAERLSKLSPTIASLNALYGYGDPLRIILTTPAGEVYRAADIAELIPRITTQAQAELADSLASDFRTYSGIAERAVMRGQPAERLTELQQSRGRRAFRAYTGLDPATGEVGQNVFNEMADAQDLTFRVGVLIDALESGRPVDEAMTLAQDALFDYGRMTAFERQYLSKVIWFWTFRRENLRATLINLVENPERIRATYQGTTGILRGYDDEIKPTSADYMTVRPFLRLFEDPELQRRYATYGPSAPMMDALSEMIDYATAGAMLIDGTLYSLTGAEMIPGQLRTATTAAGRRAEAAGTLSQALASTFVEERVNPFLSGALELGMGIQGNEKGQALTDYLDPRFLAYMDLNPDAAEMFGLAIEIEPIPYESEIPGNGHYQGRQWRLKADPGNLARWSMIRHAMILGGFERTVKDYAPTYHALTREAGEVAPLSLEPRISDAPEALNLFFRSIGVSSPTNILTREERRRRNISEMSRELRTTGRTQRSTPETPKPQE